MIDIGNLDQFGFRIGPVPLEGELRKVSIFVGGRDLTDFDNNVYLPSFVYELTLTSEWLKRRIDYLKYQVLFRDLNVTQIHNLLLHGNPDVFADDGEWSLVSTLHRFSDWGETTDGFTTFLIPYCDRLYLTYQSRDSASSYAVLDVVDGVETTPFYLISTIDDAVSRLESET